MSSHPQLVEAAKVVIERLAAEQRAKAQTLDILDQDALLIFYKLEALTKDGRHVASYHIARQFLGRLATAEIEAVLEKVVIEYPALGIIRVPPTGKQTKPRWTMKRKF